VNLFYDPADLGSIRANARTNLLGPMFREWAQQDPLQISAAWKVFSENLLFIGGPGNREALNALMQGSVAQLIEPTRERSRHLREAMRIMIHVPHWDFYRANGTTVLGTLRASSAIVRLLFARQVLADDLDADFDDEILRAIIEKGCLPCLLAIRGMNHPETVEGWGFDERHRDLTVLDLDVSRWPMILGSNNFRAVIASAIGIAAITLREKDDRASGWLELSVESMDRVMKFFEPDGSFYEGISYADYTLRTALAFFDVHQRQLGTVQFKDRYAFDPFIDHFLTMQAGRNADGSPDHVNFSDARVNVSPGVAAWIGRQTGNPLAQYVAEKRAVPRFFHDFLWFQPGQPVKPPPPALRNVRNDLDWILCRSGWEAGDAVLAFRSGGPANHEHADRNHLIFKAYGERLLHDQTGASYDRHHPLWLLRHSEAHNTVLVGGRGQQYHDGAEGTNESLSYANITRYEDLGHLVWWTSDATSAYRIDNYHIFKVERTVIFSKPDIVVILDQVKLRYWPQSVDVRFFPDHRDGAARLETDGGSTFVLRRPMACLHGSVHARGDVRIAPRKLDVPEANGVYPFIEVSTDEALRHDVLTVLTALPDSAQLSSPTHQVNQTPDGWRLETGRLQALLLINGRQPVVELL